MEKYNDNELIDLILENSEEATNILYEKYKGVIDYIVNKHSLIAPGIGLDRNDLYQEGMIGLIEAVKDYKESQNVSFYTFANICINRKIISCLNKNSRQKHKLLNEAISLDFNYDEDGETTLADFVSSIDSSPEEYVLNLESKEEVLKKIKSLLTDLEMEVFSLRTNGFTYSDIAKLLNKNIKSIDNTMGRIKLKLKKITN